MCLSAVREEGSFLLSKPSHPRRKMCIKPPPHHRTINRPASIHPHPPIPSSSSNSHHHTPFFSPTSHQETPREQQEQHEPKQEDEQDKQDQDQHGDREKGVQGLGDLKLRNSYSTSTPVLASSFSASTVSQ